MQEMPTKGANKLQETSIQPASTLAASNNKIVAKPKKKYRERRPDDPPLEPLPNEKKTQNVTTKEKIITRKQRERPWYDDYEEDDERYGYRSGMYEDKPFTPRTGWYMTGNADFVYQFQGETQDYTACDMECGYCGRCSY